MPKEATETPLEALNAYLDDLRPSGPNLVRAAVARRLAQALMRPHSSGREQPRRDSRQRGAFEVGATPTSRESFIAGGLGPGWRVPFRGECGIRRGLRRRAGRRGCGRTAAR